jgi:hypothetical protein
MKKQFLFLGALLIGLQAVAQTPYGLSGTSYTQNFDNIASGLPSGWRVDSMVNKNAGLGNDAFVRFSPTAVSWAGSTARGFKNVASADGLNATSTSGDQSASTDRALGVRQVGSTVGWDDKDSLVSVSFGMANTNGLTGFNLQFKIQSLHTGAKRYHNWIVQYGIGANPATFTTVTTTPAVLTLDSNFSNTTVSVNFGSALNNQNQAVWIRLMPSDTTMGSGSRPLVGIDDFQLSWTGIAVNNTPQVVSYTPASAANNVATSTSSLSITFDKNITIGTGNVTLKNLTDATNQTIAAGTCTAAGAVVTIPGITLAAGKKYAVQYDSTCFKNVTYSCLGVYDTTSWFFFTAPPTLPPVTSLNETFTGCAQPMFGLFKDFSAVGAQTWRCSNFGRNDTDAVYMNGYAAGATQDNEDWLISPSVDFSAMTNPNLHFWSKRRFSGNNTKEVLVSSNYAGDPNTATWTNLNVNFSNLDTVYSFFNNNNLTSYKSTPFHIAFKYVSQSAGTADEWSLDDIYVTDGAVGVQTFEQAGLQVLVLGEATDELRIQLVDSKASAYTADLCDLNGRVLQRIALNTHAGKNTFRIGVQDQASGLYLLRIQNREVSGTLKCIIR